MPRRNNLEMKVDSNQIQEILRELRGLPGDMIEAERNAVKKTAKTAKVRMVRAFAKDVNLKRSEIKDRVRTIRHPRRGSAFAVISISGFKISLWNYSRSMADIRGFISQEGVPVKSRKPKKGASWKVWKNGKRVRNTRFVATAERKSGQFQIIQRDPLSKRGGKAAKAPDDYRKAYGPSLAWLASRRKIIEPVLAEVATILEKNLRSQVDRFLKRQTTQGSKFLKRNN